MRLFRRIVMVLIPFMLLCASAYAAQRIEDFTVEKSGAFLTVTVPDGYPDKGFFKLFWKHQASGDVQSAVFPADTLSYQIEAEAGAEYSFQLFYAKKRGSLPAFWKNDQPKEPRGPAVWKVLWMDAETIDFRGFTNHMTEDNHRLSEEASESFEALVEEFTGGLVDIEITRLTVDEPVTHLFYDPNFGYYLKQDDINMKHYAMHRYDTVFVFGRMDHIYRIYDGISVKSETSREDPLFAFIPLTGDEVPPEERAEKMERLKYICVHEWLHLMGYFYSTYRLEIPNPDKPEEYGSTGEYGADDMQLIKDALVMNVISEDGRYIGVPPEAWQYMPTHATGKRNLSQMQEEKPPAEPPFREKRDSGTSDTSVDPAILGTLDGIRYENGYMGLGFIGYNWRFLSMKDYLSVFPAYIVSEIEKNNQENDNQYILAAGSLKEPLMFRLAVNHSGAAVVKEKGEEAWLQDRIAELEQFQMEDYQCEVIHRRIGNIPLFGLKYSYSNNSFMSYSEVLYRLNGDRLDFIVIGTFMFDNCDSILERFCPLQSVPDAA
ncbi:MAG: hypothetical protein IKS46_05565 [Clostridia bacterium]|nr:hypothetical protein [Clostridia bacterium]